MGVEIFGSGFGVNPDQDLDVRIVEDFSGTMIWNGANTTPDQLKFGGRQDGTHNILGNTSGGILAGGAQVAGRRILQGSSAAGVVFRRGSTAAAFSFPLSQDFSAPNGYGGLALGRRFRSYLYQVAIRLTAQAAGSVWEMSLAESDTLIDIGGTRPGPAWVCRQAVSGGRWIVRYRPVNGGAITTLADSGIAPTGWHVPGIRYVEGPSPRIEWLMDGAVVTSVAGFANMPTYPGGGLIEPGWTAAYGWAAGVGSIAQMGPALNESRYL